MKWVCKKTGVDKTSEVIKRLEEMLIKDGYTIVSRDYFSGEACEFHESKSRK